MIVLNWKSRKAGVSCDKRLDAMTEEDWKAITQLEKLYLGEIRPKEESAWYIWEWNDRVVPFFLMKYPDGKARALAIGKKLMYAEAPEKEDNEYGTI